MKVKSTAKMDGFSTEMKTRIGGNGPPEMFWDGWDYILKVTWDELTWAFLCGDCKAGNLALCRMSKPE